MTLYPLKDDPQRPGPGVSVVIPLYNEAQNVRPMLEELFLELDKLGRSHEVIAVDDGSKDSTFEELRSFAQGQRGLRVIRFRRNFGQTAAMSAGIEAARGEVVIPMDGDMQNDPKDIPRLLQILEGKAGGDGAYDVVSGWRKHRRDRELGRKLPSRIANRLISSLTGVRLHDYGCSLKAYRREVLSGVRLYGEMHRFIPIYASWQGARVTEEVVNHRPRRAGKSKYGLGRTGKVLLDLFVVKFLASYTTKPIYLFGGLGLGALLLGLSAFALALGVAFAGKGALLTLAMGLSGVVFSLCGVLSLLMGLLAELLVRTYFESQDKRPYVVADQLNHPEVTGLSGGEAHVRYRG